VRTENRFVKNIGPFKPKWFRQYRVEVLLAWAWKIVWLALDWRLFIVLVLVPNLYAVWGIFGTNFWQHDGCDENHPYNHSRNFTNKLFNFLVCNNGYHGAHHMKPGMHWSLYPEYHEKYIRPYLHPALHLNSLTVYCWQAFIYPGKRVDYLGDPVVPVQMEDSDWVMETRVAELEPSDMGVEAN
jgi:fatty acid desaturase